MNTFFLHPAGWLVLVIIFIALLLFGLRIFGQFNTVPNKKEKKKPLPQPSTNRKVCPVCNEELAAGEAVRTQVFQGDNADRLCYIYGCPRCCSPALRTTARRCPVCSAPVPVDGYLFARYHSYKGKGAHIQITGCKECR